MKSMLARVHHLCLTALLTLALVISGQAIAQAKGASPATGHMVLCTGHGVAVVFTDAEGQPTAPPHICPDCMLSAVIAPMPHAAPELRFDPPSTRICWIADTGTQITPLLSAFNARGPPLSV